MRKRKSAVIAMIGAMALSAAGCAEKEPEIPKEGPIMIQSEPATESKSTTESETEDPTAETPEKEVQKTSEYGILDQEKLLLKKMAGKENGTISPAGLYSCLALVKEGAAGGTKNQLDDYIRVMDEPVKSDTVQEANFALFRDPSEIHSKAKDSYKEVLKSKFDSELIEIKNDQVSKTVKKLNQKIEKLTNGQIPNAINEKYVSGQDFVACLSNAIHFQGTWEKEDGYDTIEKYDFTTADGEKVQVKALDIRNAELFETDNAKGCVVNYADEDGRYSFYAFLPNEEGELELEALDLKNLEYPNNAELTVHLPSFEIGSNYEMADILAATGLSDMFDSEKCDMTAGFDIQDGYNVYFSNVEQKTKVKLDEKGTEASAVTSAYAVETTALLDPAVPEEITLDFNRPFVYMIYDNDANVPLFLGQVCDPTAE